MSEKKHAGNLNALRTGEYSRYLAPVYRFLPPQTRAFMRVAVTAALSAALTDLPPDRRRRASRRRHQARVRALGGILQLLAAADFSTSPTRAGMHLVVVQAMAPIFLDPLFLRSEFRPLPVEWPLFEDRGDDLESGERAKTSFGELSHTALRHTGRRD